MRFADQELTLAGVTGERIEIPSADPVNYHEAITAAAECPERVVDGLLFAPGGTQRPLVVVVPGSLGVGPNHVAHAETLIGVGYAVFVLDPFGARSVSSTVGNQTQYSFAASALDVVRTLEVVAADPRIDVERIAAQGHSRGGSAVITAAHRRFADAVAGADVAFAAVYAVYPWCGHQFLDADVGDTSVRAIVGDQDDWVSVQQVQAQLTAIGRTGADATVRVVPGAAHSFDRLEPLHELEEASVAPTAPTIYLADDGSMIDPASGRADAGLTDRDLFVAAVRGGFGRRGAHIGGVGDQPAVFRADMVEFYSSVFA